MSPEDVIQEAHLVAGSLHTRLAYNIWFRDLLHAQLDALLWVCRSQRHRSHSVGEQECRWLRSATKLRPNWLEDSQIFLKAVLRMMDKEKILGPGPAAGAPATTVTEGDSATRDANFGRE
eukprot:Polyplicarium_translucidae@DN5197_c0_g1_i2.p2